MAALSEALLRSYERTKNVTFENGGLGFLRRIPLPLEEVESVEVTESY